MGSGKKKILFFIIIIFLDKAIWRTWYFTPYGVWHNRLESVTLTSHSLNSETRLK